MVSRKYLECLSSIDKEDKSIPHYISLLVRRRNHDTNPKQWGKSWGEQSYIFQVHTVNTKGSFVGCRQGITENCQSIQLLIFNTFIDKIRVFVDFSERTANFGFEVYFFWSEFDSHNAHETQFLCQSKQIYIYIYFIAHYLQLI